MERSPLEELVPVLSSVKVSCEPVAASSSFQTSSSADWGSIISS